MCFLEVDEGKGPCIRIIEYRNPPMRVSIPPPSHRRRRYSSSSSDSSSSSSSNSSSHNSTIVCPPRHAPRSHSHSHHCESPRPSYTTVSRRRVRTLEESLGLAPRRKGWWFGSRESLPERRNRNISVRRRNSVPSRNRFSISTLRGTQQPELSKRMNRLIKNENAAIAAYEKAGRQRVSIAKDLSDWGEATEDDAVSDITDKLGVLLAEMGDQEELFAAYLEEYRTVLKHIRETESSVQPSRNHRAKIADDIAKLKIKDPESIKLETLEQELVRAEAQSLVAEAQLTNMTRSKLKEAFDIHLAAVIERGEKHILLARHARRLLGILDDSPVVPGEPRQDYDRGDMASQIIMDAERDLRSWESTTVPIPTSAGQMHDSTLLPARAARESQAITAGEYEEDGAVMSDSARDVTGSVSEARYAGGYPPDAQDTHDYASRAPNTGAYIPGTQEAVEPTTETHELQEPVAEPVRGTHGTHGGPSDAISYIPGTKQRVDPVTGAEGLGESSTEVARGVDRGASGVTGYTSGVLDTSQTIPGTKEQVESVIAARGFDEPVTDTPDQVTENISNKSIHESITDPTRHFDEPSTELTEGTEVTQAVDDNDGSILAEVRSAREKLQEQPQAALGIPQAVAVPY
ncbi:hypothetical protein ETB97_007119 [Aspergillus alliaceus]|uniref:Eisosome component PIL1-domain-containing protein n=1 Tax=Petromyces alliaceus TaxID=209559 RepID=A0A8H6E256_PETAA|nr:hypothetical protein ETB97_007119 [Aspergillus burnettii]